MHNKVSCVLIGEQKMLDSDVAQSCSQIVCPSHVGLIGKRHQRGWKGKS